MINNNQQRQHLAVHLSNWVYLSRQDLLCPQTRHTASRQQDAAQSRDPLPHREMPKSLITMASRRTRSKSTRAHRTRKRPRSRSRRPTQPSPTTVHRPSSSSTRNSAHPTYARSTMSRRSSPSPRSVRPQSYQRKATYSTNTIGRDQYTKTGTHHSRQRRAYSTSPSMCSRPREHHRTSRATRRPVDREAGILTDTTARPKKTSSTSGIQQPEPESEPTQTLDEPFEMEIPTSIDIPLADWSQLSPEPPEQGQEDDEPIVQTDTVWQDRTTLVKAAYEDSSRTKAVCELVHAGILCLTQKIRTKKYNTFLRVLQTRNPGTPSTILGNMANYFRSIRKNDTKASQEILYPQGIRHLRLWFICPYSFWTKTWISRWYFHQVLHHPWHYK